MREVHPENRFPKRLFRLGTEPDPRFSLANERTLLAWMRTALALIAAGIALEVLAGDLAPAFRAAAAIVLVSTGICIPLIAWIEWARTERSMRLERPLPAPTLAIGIGVAITAAGVLVVIGMLA